MAVESQLAAGTEGEGGGDLSAMLAAVQEHWLGSFVLNLIGYALIIIPAALLIRRWKASTAIKNGRTLTFVQRKEEAVSRASVCYYVWDFPFWKDLRLL